MDRGCLVCSSPDGEKRLPKDDILAVIVAARGVLFTADCISALLENNTVIIHCNDKYQPIGKTIRLNQIVHSEIFERQIKLQDPFADVLWKEILKAKTKNQAILLDLLSKEHKLWEMLNQNNIDESNAAKHYWSIFFSSFKSPPKTRERRGASEPVNQMLNYTYAVIGAILHRSIVAHGLNAQLGIHHKYRFKSDPLLYDLMEPLRPICDYMLVKFHLNNSKKKIQEWIKFVGKEMTDLKFRTDDKKTIKMMYEIDRYVNSVADCFYTGNTERLRIPCLSDVEIEKKIQ
ncbi:MAG: type II CRISPR-associated endonuclease Cas1 [Elusimicrobiota bacterium]